MAAFLFFFCFPAAAEENCSEIAETYRVESLTRLFRLEKYYVTAAWNYRKSQETIYNPLWEANLRRNDRFSKERRIEGEVIYGRYRHEADGNASAADKSARKMMRESEKLKKVWPAGIRCGEADADPGIEPSQSTYDICRSLWRNEWDQKNAELERTLKEFQLWEGKISLAAEKTLSETPSDHPQLTDRFRDYFSEIDLRVSADFQRTVRALRELLEIKWRAEECCQVCAEDRTAATDPVFNKVKLELIGPRGVDGKTYEKSSLLEAFKGMKKEASEEETRS